MYEDGVASHSERFIPSLMETVHWFETCEATLIWKVSNGIYGPSLHMNKLDPAAANSIFDFPLLT
jgi:hypothetical protein